MTDFAIAHRAGSTVHEVVAGCVTDLGRPQGHTLGFVYATGQLAAAFEGIVEQLTQATGVTDWVGTVGTGICATGIEYFDQPALVAMTCRFAPTSYRVLESTGGQDGLPIAEARAGGALLGITHADPRNPQIVDVVGELARQHGLYLVGGLSSSDRAMPQVAGNVISEGGVSGVLIADAKHQLSVGLTQGCSPIGPLHEVTLALKQIIVELDGRPAFEVMREDASASESDDPNIWLANLQVALPISGSDRADYVVRNLAGIDREQGFVAIANMIEEGDRVMFVRRDRQSAERDLDRMLADMKKRAKVPPQAGLYFSCLARGPNLFEREAHEMKAIEQAFGPIPIVGFFGNGEIANDRVYGYTGVLALFS